ncbi:IST1 homolog [Selaginella moellendorffii]|uniref:IST1 homolog n=1 Tax=Selaginella moellendorffii TaxID=88036 RepID=UPI000D1C30C8|nr:IST1 homolog [Selaginella moellendorffii]|eukprot:XP_002971060.2 IST1 homolog [Selaginella moellendorffii]
MDFLGRGFKAAKCKTLLRLAMSRIKLLRNRRELQVRGMRREIANLLQTGQEPSARIRVEHIFREQNIMAAYEIVELFCELVVVRLPIIESQKQCPLDLKEAIASLIFAAPRCSDLPELLEVRGLFAVKYGKEFVASAGELRPDCGVNRRIIEKLSVRAPSGEVKLKLLKEIAAEHNIEWNASETEAELTKQHEDLLDGPSQFISSSQRPLAASSRVSSQHASDNDMPSVPSQSMRSQFESRPGNVLQMQDLEPEEIKSSKYEERQPSIRPVSPPPEPAAPQRDNERQFVPFISPPPVHNFETPPPPPPPPPPPQSVPSFHEEKEPPMEYKDVVAAAQAAADSAERAATAARAAANLAKGTSFSRARPSQEVDADGSDVEMPAPPASFANRWDRTKQDEDEDESSDSDDNHATSKFTPKKPFFDSDDERDEDGRRMDRRTSVSPPRAAQQPAKYDLFDLGAEERRNSGGFSSSAPYKQQNNIHGNLFSDEGQTFFTGIDDGAPPPSSSFHRRRDNPPPPSFDFSPTPSMPQFDEPEFNGDGDDGASIPLSKTSSGSGDLKWQKSIPPQRAPPELPKPPASRTDSGGSSGGHSVHPKLPDYDDLTARFQALKTRR